LVIFDSRMAHSYQTLTIRELKERVTSGRLDLNPDWQRGSVWTREERRRLIDSIDNGYPVPHITMWTRPYGRSVMVDGKQRTETIVGFTNDEFCAEDDDWFSGRSQDRQEMFLDKQIHVLVFDSVVDEDFIVEYFDRRNSKSKQLSNGELINSLCGKPLVSNVMRMFFTENNFRQEWSAIFGDPQTDAKRMNYHENTIPYLTSSMFGVNRLTKSYPVLAQSLKTTRQEEIDNHMPEFMGRINIFLDVCRRIFEECPHIRPNWTKQGLPPLRQVSAIWLSVLEPQHISNPVDFWPRFYRIVSNNPVVKNEWNLYMRKNGKPTQLYRDIQFAVEHV
jgi:hypothetical protein